jgi:hypothetical protein
MNATKKAIKKPPSPRLESRVVPIDIDIAWEAGMASFTFTGPGNVVSTHGEINLAGHAKRVLLLFNLVSSGGEYFDDPPIAAEVIQHTGSTPCPSQTAGLHAPFKEATTDPSKRLLVVTDDNSADTKKKYQYALFFKDGKDNVFSSDPRIINN